MSNRLSRTRQKTERIAMNDTLKAGLKTVRSFTIDRGRTIDFLGTASDEKAMVYATPALVQDIEQTCRDFLLEHLDEGEDTLGTEVNIKHLAPTLLGMSAEVRAEVSALNGRAVSLAITVRDPVDDVVASGNHERFVINVGKTLDRLKQKADAFEQIS